LKIFSLEVTLIRDQGWINVGAFGLKFNTRPFLTPVLQAIAKFSHEDGSTIEKLILKSKLF